MNDRAWYLTVSVVIIVAVVFGIAMGAYGQTAELQPMTITIPISDVQRGDPGDVFLVATEPLPEGINCAGTLKTNNNSSRHPDTNIIMESGTTATIFDVEVKSYESRTLALRSGVFESDGSVRVFVQVGADGVSSTGFDLVIDCGGTTTTTTEPPTTTEPSTVTTTGPVTTSSSIPTGIPSGVGPVGDDMPWQMTALAIVALTVLGGLALREWLHHGNRNE